MLGTGILRAGAVVLMLLATACASNVERPATQGKAGLPGIPDDPQLSAEQIERNASVFSTLSRQGDQVVDFSPGSTMAGGAITLTPGADGLAWALYSLGPLHGYEAGDTLIVKVPQDAGTAGLWAAVADYDANRWEIAPLDFASNLTVVALDPQQVLASGSGVAYVAIISYAAEPRTVSEVRLTTDEVGPPPVGGTASQATSNTSIHLSWENPAHTFDPDGAGPLQFDYEGVWVYRSETEDGQYGFVEIVPAQPGSTALITYEDTDTSLMPAATYYYKLRTQQNGIAARFSVPFMGQVGSPPEADFTADYLDFGGQQDVTLIAIGSDPDGGEIDYYHWDVNADGTIEHGSADPEWVVSLDMNMEQLVELIVFDDEGYSASMQSSFGPAICPDLDVQDDISQPDPGAPGTLSGQGPGSYAFDLYFEILSGTPNFRVEMDTHYDGTFGMNMGVPTIMVKDFNNGFNGFGPYAFTDVNIPASQPNGSYTFALRVTDSCNPPNVVTLVYPNLVHLFPQP
jgi:hypothetical protein